MSPLAPFGTQRGELASCDIALALRRAKERREAMERRREQIAARRRARLAAFRRRIGLAAKEKR